jgi:hypothetical protein
MRSLEVDDIKDFSIASDTNVASFTLVTKYAGDLGISLPAACLNALQPRSGLPASMATNGSREALQPGAKTAELTLALAKTWLVAADKKKGVAVIVSNHGSPVQTGFAVNPQEARKLAAAILKQANALEAAATPSQT